MWLVEQIEEFLSLHACLAQWEKWIQKLNRVSALRPAGSLVLATLHVQFFFDQIHEDRYTR